MQTARPMFSIMRLNPGPDVAVMLLAPAQEAPMTDAMAAISPWLDGLAATTKGVTFLKYVFSQGCSRKENFLYRSDPAREREDR